MTGQEWFSPADRLPNDGQAVSWLDGRGRQTDGWYESRLWWFTDRKMYIYYTPTFWKARKQP